MVQKSHKLFLTFLAILIFISSFHCLPTDNIDERLANDLFSSLEKDERDELFWKLLNKKLV
jgi:hypothetical protein